MMEIEKAAFDDFMCKYKNSKDPNHSETTYVNQRLGQAFYNHFGLHKIKSSGYYQLNHNRGCLDGIYEADGEEAMVKIRSIFMIR